MNSVPTSMGRYVASFIKDEKKRVLRPGGKRIFGDAERRWILAEAKADPNRWPQLMVRPFVPQWGSWLKGDTDCDPELLRRLALVARDAKRPLFVNYGKRTYAEQKELYDKYGSPRAAKPGTSPHESGRAADVVLGANHAIDIGDLPECRTAMKKRGLCLPVPGEPWHVEIDRGQGWRA
jgi:hypothetical protein